MNLFKTGVPRLSTFIITTATLNNFHKPQQYHTLTHYFVFVIIEKDATDPLG
jgi:hypothetical protein